MHHFGPVTTAERNDTAAPIEHPLLREICHRVNNEYAFAVSAIGLRAMRSSNDDVKAALAEVADLFMRLADVHKTLSPPDFGEPLDVCTYVRNICLAIGRARLQERNVKLIFFESGSQVLPASHCWKLGLVISELITNSVRHAFRSTGGQISVTIASRGTTLHCCIQDNGRRTSPSPPGSGLKIIDSLLRSMGGWLDYDFSIRGAVSTISLPVMDV